MTITNADWSALPGPTADLAESPVWDEAAESLLWVDIHRGEVWSSDDAGARLLVTLPERVGALGVAAAGGLVLGLESGFARWTPERGLRRLAEVEADLPSTRLNDGRVDRQGRFVCGGMDESTPQQGISHVHRLDAAGRATTLVDDVHCANSTAFSPDGTVMYFTDMPSGRIVAYDYDAEDTALSAPRVFADLRDQPGLADGSTVDAEGFVWTAMWGGGRILRIDPHGAIERILPVPVSNPTSLAFGGPGYDRLFVTTARFGLDPERLRAEPLAGRILALDPGVRGLAEPRYLD